MHLWVIVTNLKDHTDTPLLDIESAEHSIDPLNLMSVLTYTPQLLEGELK